MVRVGRVRIGGWARFERNGGLGLSMLDDTGWSGAMLMGA
jgi:hypothetical protein